jgi:hypothetical protein
MPLGVFTAACKSPSIVVVVKERSSAESGATNSWRIELCASTTPLNATSAAKRKGAIARGGRRDRGREGVIGEEPTDISVLQ